VVLFLVAKVAKVLFLLAATLIDMRTCLACIVCFPW
jgi:hypothetical protein